jgi:hypothetical protein
MGNKNGANGNNGGLKGLERMNGPGDRRILYSGRLIKETSVAGLL